jgi:hypothetical protein
MLEEETIMMMNRRMFITPFNYLFIYLLYNIIIFNNELYLYLNNNNKNKVKNNSEKTNNIFILIYLA